MMYHNVRQRLETKEEALSTYAIRSRLSRGRQRPEEPCPVRTAFQRDRDRIIHCKAFRRLKHKTQVFIAPAGDHYVTRLTHTLEVAQIARTISRALNLNEDLTEAMALGHDLGHTPFGHIGEDVLNQLYPEGFRHNEQSLRVVDILENDGLGLNLTQEVREGILNHSKSGEEILGQGWGHAPTLEAEVVKISDSVAYLNHDIDDAIRAGLISDEDLPASVMATLGSSRSQRINTLVCDIIAESWAATGEERQDREKPQITMSPRVLAAANDLRQFLWQRVYEVSSVGEAERAKETVSSLYHYFLANGDQLPAEYGWRRDPLERQVVDYIASMTDRYATEMLQTVGIKL
ncbi:MAG: deoxyguanosinetriphosphate triphosphohydrolase [Chloroflexi bacterium]|nr:deoxyguanosinetriphosphate triphosphohydrolase [Chloroflexota bacterium]